MALNVNPATDGGEGGAFCKNPGPHVFAGVGMERCKSQKGTEYYKVRMVCLEDRTGSPDPDTGRDVLCNFNLQESSVWVFGRFARAVGHDDPFDADNAREFLNVVKADYFVADVEMEKYDGKDRAKIDAKTFDAYEGEVDPGWDDICGEAETRHERILERQAEKAKGGGGGGGGRGRGRGGGGKGGGGRARDDDPAPAADRGYNADDIPF